MPKPSGFFARIAWWFRFAKNLTIGILAIVGFAFVASIVLATRHDSRPAPAPVVTQSVPQPFVSMPSAPAVPLPTPAAASPPSVVRKPEPVVAIAEIPEPPKPQPAPPVAL